MDYLKPKLRARGRENSASPVCWPQLSGMPALSMIVYMYLDIGFGPTLCRECQMRKGTRSDSVLWREPLYQTNKWENGRDLTQSYDEDPYTKQTNEKMDEIWLSPITRTLIPNKQMRKWTRSDSVLWREPLYQTNKWENGRDLTQSYDENPYTKQTNEKMDEIWLSPMTRTLIPNKQMRKWTRSDSVLWREPLYQQMRKWTRSDSVLWREPLYQTNKWENGRDLTQSYDENPYTKQTIQSPIET